MLLYLLLAVASGAAASDSAARAFERAERRLAENRLDEASALYQQAIAERLVDECHLLLGPVLVGGGKRALPTGVHAELELLDERRFRSGVVYLRYRPR